MLEQIIGKSSHPLSREDLLARIAGYQAVHIDLGCGDGMLPYRRARENPHIFYIGIDAARESLAVASAKAAKKPARGGCENALFLCMNLLEPNPDVTGIADRLLFNFPWGSLMRAVADPDVPALQRLRALAKAQATFELYLNLYVFQNDKQREDMNLPLVDAAFVQQILMPGWQAAGLAAEHWKMLPPATLQDHPSTWAGRLVRRSGRDTLFMEGTCT